MKKPKNATSPFPKWAYDSGLSEDARREEIRLFERNLEDLLHSFGAEDDISLITGWIVRETI